MDRVLRTLAILLVAAGSLLALADRETGEEARAARIASAFAQMAGSEDNAMALVLAMRTGIPVRIVDAAHPALEVTLIEPPVQAMEWPAIEGVLTSAARALESAGWRRANGEQLRAVLMGGPLRRSDGVEIQHPGVLQLYADGIE